MLPELLSFAGDYALSCLIQWLIGMILSIFVFKFFNKHNGLFKLNVLILALLSTLTGLLLPLGTFGILPLYIAILCAGGSTVAFLPLLASNMVFNMLIPLTEMNFSWETSILRILAAFLIGIAAFLLSHFVFKNEQDLLRKGILEKYQKTYHESGFTGILSFYINEMGLFLILGVLASAAKSLFITDAMGFILNTPVGGVAKDFLFANDANNSPFFISAATIFNTVSDLTIPAAFLSFIRLRGVLLKYIITGIVCALLLMGILI